MKEKISITIDSELIRKADSLIDSISVRNRSQALESLLRKALAERDIDCAVILAGGEMSRLSFGETFKPLAKIEGIPILVNTISRLKSAGITRIMIAAGPIKERVFELVGDGSEYGVKITYIKDNKTGTAGALRNAARYISGPFFVILGDVYFDFDLRKMIDFHRVNREIATMAVSVTELGDSNDSLKITGNKITEFSYQPRNSRTYHVNAGIYLFNEEILPMIAKGGSLEKESLPSLARQGHLSGFVFSGQWRHLK